VALQPAQKAADAAQKATSFLRIRSLLKGAQTYTSAGMKTSRGVFGDPLQVDIFQFQNDGDTMKRFCIWLLGAILVGAAANQASGQGKKGTASAAAPANTTASSTASGASSSAAIESQMLAYGGLDHIASAIAAKVCPQIDSNTSHTVVIYDQASFVSVQSYEAFIANGKAIVAAYETLLPEDNDPDHYDKKTLNRKIEEQGEKEHPNRFQPRALGLSSTIDPFSDATALLSAIAVSSNSESPASIVIPDSAMAVAIARELKQYAACSSKGINVIYPPLFGNSSSTDVSSADIQTDLQKVHDVRDFVTKGVDAQNTRWIAANRGTGTPPSANPVLTGALSDVNTMYDSFMNSLLQINSSTGNPGSSSVIQGYQLANVLAGPVQANGSFIHPAFVLLASILSAGGTMRDHKTLWTALSTGDKITFSGGVIVNVALWHPGGDAPIYSELLRYRAPFAEVHNPGNLEHVSDGDNLGPKP